MTQVAKPCVRDPGGESASKKSRPLRVCFYFFLTLLIYMWNYVVHCKDCKKISKRQGSTANSTPKMELRRIPCSGHTTAKTTQAYLAKQHKCGENRSPKTREAGGTWLPEPNPKYFMPPNKIYENNVEWSDQATKGKSNASTSPGRCSLLSSASASAAKEHTL